MSTDYYKENRVNSCEVNDLSSEEMGENIYRDITRVFVE